MGKKLAVAHRKYTHMQIICCKSHGDHTCYLSTTPPVHQPKTPCNGSRPFMEQTCELSLRDQLPGMPENHMTVDHTHSNHTQYQLDLVPIKLRIRKRVVQSREWLQERSQLLGVSESHATVGHTHCNKTQYRLDLGPNQTIPLKQKGDNSVSNLFHLI